MKQTLLKTLYRFLAFCARVYLYRTKPFVIGVTGSVGKTNCRLVITQVLSSLIETQGIASLQKKIVYTSPKNYNSELGLIFSIFKIEDYNPSMKNLLKISWDIFKMSLMQKKQYDVLVAEYGIDTSGDMDFLLSIMIPDIGVLTKLDSVHSDNFKRGVTELWEDKFKLLLASKQKCYFNSQDDFSNHHEALLSQTHEKIFVKTPKSLLKKTENGLTQSFISRKKNISINLLGEENIEYTILALSIANDLGIKLLEKEYNFEYTLQAGRFSMFERNEHIFIDSSYNAGPESMKKIIANTKLVQSELYPEHKIIYVLGDMREIGEARESAHQLLCPLISNSDAIMMVGPDMYSLLLPKLKQSGYSGDMHSSLSSREVGKYLKKYLHERSENKYVILFKGSQNTIFTEEALAPQLLASQRNNLPRCSEDWMAKKDEFFRSL